MLGITIYNYANHAMLEFMQIEMQSWSNRVILYNQGWRKKISRRGDRCLHVKGTYIEGDKWHLWPFSGRGRYISVNRCLGGARKLLGGGGD